MSDAEFLSRMADLQRMQMRQMMEISSGGGGAGGAAGGGGVGAGMPYRAPSVAAMLRMIASGGGGTGGAGPDWSELSLLRGAGAPSGAAAPSGPRGAAAAATGPVTKAPKVAPNPAVGDKPKREFVFLSRGRLMSVDFFSPDALFLSAVLCCPNRSVLGVQFV